MKFQKSLDTYSEKLIIQQKLFIWTLYIIYLGKIKIYGWH